jgi:acyl-CoA reductase-like NAD-dependent aldehyde dehydrogenase
MATGKNRRTELDAEDRNALPESAFAFPRVRKEPLNDASHVRNAIARFDQVRDVSDAEREEAFRRIKRAAEKHGIEMTETRWQDLGKPSATMKSSDKPRTPTKAELAGSKRAGRSKDELYAEAKRRDIKGRSSMTKTQLQSALER